MIELTLFDSVFSFVASEAVKYRELRATVSLCRLWQTQSNQIEASTLLAEIYGRFTEGADSPTY